MYIPNSLVGEIVKNECHIFIKQILGMQIWKTVWMLNVYPSFNGNHEALF
jgi:hypothetical protein